MAASLGFFVASVSKAKLSISRDGEEERIAIIGNLFYASLDPLARHLRSDPSACTVLDLTRVPYCDAAAQQLIKKIQAQRARHGGRLEIAAADSSMRPHEIASFGSTRDHSTTEKPPLPTIFGPKLSRRVAKLSDAIFSKAKE